MLLDVSKQSTAGAKNSKAVEGLAATAAADAADAAADEVNNENEAAEAKILMEKQELFIELLAEKSIFSRIKKIETPLKLSLKSLK